ncbi:mechanosensitive ion channel [bacterium]|nr:mechanosensitive ion channel [bacterium]
MLEEFRYELGDGLLDLGLAVLIIAAGWLVALLLGKIVAKVVRTVGDERISQAMGVKAIDSRRPPSRVLGSITRAAIMLYATLEAFEVLGFELGAELITRFLTFGGDVLLGVAILCLGLYLGRLAGDAVASGTGRRLRAVAPVTQGAVVVLAIFMALDQMGLASDIVQLLFIFTAGAAAVAAALAFGLGCRESAGRLFDEWVASLRSDEGSEES